jgi:hypothetical protein
MYRLISATPSPYARKVRIALAEKAISFELVTEVPWDRTSITPRYNPLEKLPILLLEDGNSIYESSYILEYLELKHPAPPLISTDCNERLASRKLEVLCDGICDAVVLTFFERRRPAACQSGEWSQRQRRKIEGGVREMARLVGDRQWAVIGSGWVISPSAPHLGILTCAFRNSLGARSIPTLQSSAIKWRNVHPLLAPVPCRKPSKTPWCRGVPLHGRNRLPLNSTRVQSTRSGPALRA